ncbi:MAG: hypothetical protein LBQ79_14035, partial [Deltaproteobacteria bacterium]|nr:hypothetical protein [Deltaproteobacteria bacterium]
MAADMLRQLEAASRSDVNPFRKGASGELVSMLGPRFPEAAVLSGATFPFDGEGWVSGEALRAAAECALKRGAGLVELQPRGNLAFVPGLRSGQEHARAGRGARPGACSPVSLCPFWGPCLGREQDGLDTFRGIFAVVAREGREGFRTGLAGCARDCRRVIERSDLAALPEGPGGGISVWVGGRHRPFRPPVTPLAWRLFPAEYPGDLADFILKVQDLHGSEARRAESFPELAARLGLARIEELLGIAGPARTDAQEASPEPEAAGNQASEAAGLAAPEGGAAEIVPPGAAQPAEGGPEDEAPAEPAARLPAPEAIGPRAAADDPGDYPGNGIFAPLAVSPPDATETECAHETWSPAGPEVHVSGPGTAEPQAEPVPEAAGDWAAGNSAAFAETTAHVSDPESAEPRAEPVIPAEPAAFAASPEVAEPGAEPVIPAEPAAFAASPEAAEPGAEPVPEAAGDGATENSGAFAETAAHVSDLEAVEPWAESAAHV